MSRFATFRVLGMTCSACSGAVQSRLSQYPGVLEAAVNPINGITQLKLLPQVLQEHDVVRIIDELGYKAIAWNNNNSFTMDVAELAQAKLRILWCLLFALPTVLLCLLHPYIHPLSSFTQLEDIIVFILSTPVQFVFGWPFYVKSKKAIKNGTVTMDVLVAIASTAAYAYSVLVMIFMPDVHGVHFFETSVMLITFVLVGKYLELLAKGDASKTISHLLELQQKVAVVVEVDANFGIINEQVAQVEDVQPGQIVKLSMGTKVPVDGVIVWGECLVDESMVTGESVPVLKRSQATLIGGTLVSQGHCLLRVTNVGEHSTLARIVQLVQKAQSEKAPIQQFADKLSGYFVPFVVAVSLLTMVVWLVLGWFVVVDRAYIMNMNPTVFAIMFGIAVLVVSCPCTLGLATPMAIMVGTAIAARMGLIFKGGRALELAHSVNTVVFDKTGTLTYGTPSIGVVISFVSNLSKHEVLVRAAAIEAFSKHPHASAIVKSVESSKVFATDIVETVGQGVTGIWCGERLIVGNLEFLKSQNCYPNLTQLSEIRNLEHQGMSAAVVGRGSEVLGVIGICDTMRPEVIDVIRRLREQHIDTWLVTGDNEATARIVANSVGITNVLSGVLPQQKCEKILELKKNGRIVAMVGDGINDSPALAAADVGIAIGAGTDVAIETAEIVLINSNLWGVVKALHLSRTVFQTIKFNFAWAFVYNIISIPIAAGVFYPLLRMQLPPYVAALSMVLSSCSVMISSLSLKRYKFPME